ncbi:bifunctional hydroxymethylpyrimidine kinase/phosphomethylpyrimidine kinase [Streptomyces sp. NPDC057433]|uniref:bifunctional hydroxymethylpyrimidine kinase/phosphomethylpyrimidine kinase n=1 Tax=Streptomyces sp. NPDC057433 TaxID=3346132 RepID=UPI00368D769C
MSVTPLAPYHFPRKAQRTRCVTIGSSDSSGGAGIQGDLKAFASAGAYGASVVVGVMAQNTTGISAAAQIDTTLVEQQLKAVLDDVGADGLKVGTVISPQLVWTLVDRLVWLDEIPVVVDPVMVTTAGNVLGGDEEAVVAVREGLLPLAWVATPNLAEARCLTGLGADVSAARLAEELVELGAKAALITDAFPDEPEVRDWLFDGKEHHEIRGTRESSPCDHGAGCAHSALLTVFLARGMELVEAAHRAHELVRLAIRRGTADIGAGRHPVDVFGTDAAW